MHVCYSEYRPEGVMLCITLIVCGNDCVVMSLEATGASSYSLGGRVLSQQTAGLLL